jgi:hypothetical protein
VVYHWQNSRRYASRAPCRSCGGWTRRGALGGGVIVGDKQRIRKMNRGIWLMDDEAFSHPQKLNLEFFFG